MFSQFITFTTLVGMVVAHLPVKEPVHHTPQPYKFGYNVKDKHGDKFREETGNGAGGVKGSYGFTDERGVKRQVNYVADKAGFRAQVKTNEPGTANQNPAAVQMISDAPYAGGVALGGMGYGLGYAGMGYGAGALDYGMPAAVPAYGGYGLGYGGYGAGALDYGIPAAVPAYGDYSLGYGGYGLGGGDLGYGGYGY